MYGGANKFPCPRLVLANVGKIEKGQFEMRVWQMVGGILYVLVVIRLRDGVRPSGQQHLARLDWTDGPF